MSKIFTEQNYLIIESNVVTNIVLWDGDTTKWTPPLGSIDLIQSITPAMVWQPVVVDKKLVDYVLGEEIGVADIGFTWDGSVCTTNLPKPEMPISQPVTRGTQTI